MIPTLSLRRSRVFRTLALWLGLAALMVQGLAPLCANTMIGGSNGATSIVICTLHGSETVQLDADGKAVPSGPAKIASDCCSVCHAPNAFTTPSPILAAVPFSAVYGFARPESPFVVLPRAYSSYISRGPPPAMTHAFA